MNAPNETEIETLLRRAPQPAPPAGLKQGLMMQTKLAPETSTARPSVLARARAGWFRRWWPALAPASLGLACAAVLTVQQMEIHDLNQSLRTLSAGAAAEPVPAAPQPRSNDGAPAVDPATQAAQEIAQLKQVVRELAAEISQLEQLHLENQALRAKLAAPVTGSYFSPEETADLEKARERALRIQCINNMKQLGLAVRIWAGDHNDVFPPDIISMTNEMNTPKILYCPADTGRQSATMWSNYTSANCSYEYLGGTDTEPSRVMFRCPIHGNIGLCDGSVQSSVGKEHPEWLVQRDGKLYFEPKRSPTPPGSGFE